MNDKSRSAAVATLTALLDSVSPDVEAAIRAVADENAALRRQLQEAEQRALDLQNEAREDPLTGLLNRRGLDDQLKRAIDLVRRYDAVISLLFIDLDGFKKINDAHGHAVGDIALMHVAALLSSHVRRSDVVARLGGDEFAILLWQSDCDLAKAKAKWLTDLVDKTPLRFDSHELSLGASVGATQILSGDDDAAAILSRADKAMYLIKDQGKLGTQGR